MFGTKPIDSAALLQVNKYKPVNGLAMAWGPASRIAGPARAAMILDSWEEALAATMHSNFYPELFGGGVEQFGATDAINSALLQSQEGFLRFFAMWPSAENASFTTLRARGAFLVSASFTSGAAVAPILIVAGAGPASVPPLRNCSVLDPWATATGPWRPLVVHDTSGARVDVSADGAWPQIPVWRFAAQSGRSYSVFPPSM